MSLLKKINKYFTINVAPLVLNRQEQETYLAKFKTPKCLIERSYFQYKIQFDLLPFHKKIINNLIAFCGIFYVFIRAFFYKKKNKNKEEKGLAIFPYKNLNYENVIPREISKLYKIKSINFNSGSSFRIKDGVFLLKLFLKYPFDLYFQLKCIQKILFYRFIIDRYSPKAIISCTEYSFSSSILTLFCRKNKVKHINTMHGEKLFYIRDSFFEFDQFYVWDTHYINLFIKLRADKKQFIVGNYPFMDIELDSNIKYKYTYFLADEDDDKLKRISNSLKLLKRKGIVCVRYHPRYSSERKIKDIFGDFIVQNPIEVSLEKSFSYTEYIVSLYSSVLTQGYFLNKKILIDDLNNSKTTYDNLKDSEYFILHKEHIKLTSVLS